MSQSIRSKFVKYSIIFLTFMVLFYGFRLVHYYRKEHKKDSKNYTLIEYLINDENLTKNKYQKEKDRYYFTTNDNNYLYYSGLMYKIAYIDSNYIYAISDEAVTSLKYGLKEDYDESNIKKWIDNVYKNNLDKANLIDATLINQEDYNKIKDNLDNYNDFWIRDGYVATKKKEILKATNFSDFIDVRPFIVLKDSKYITGDGSKNNPYLLKNDSVSKLDELYVGDYLIYKDLTLRIIEKNESGVKVLSVEPLDRVRVFSLNSNKYSKQNTTDLGYYLNNNYIDNLNKKDLIKTKFYIGTYDIDYEETENESVNMYVGILKIGDYFISNYDSMHLLTPSNDEIYTINENNELQVQSILTRLNVHPVFTLDKNLSIISGNGRENNPYKVGEV